MDRNFEQLTAEANKIGLRMDPVWSKDELENALRDFYWNKNHPG